MRNLILLSILDSNKYRWGANDGVLKVVHDDILKGKKCEGYYLLVRSLAQDGVPSIRWSSVQSGVLGAGRLDMR